LFFEAAGKLGGQILRDFYKKPVVNTIETLYPLSLYRNYFVRMERVVLCQLK
jgi:hypothetical protein